MCISNQKNYIVQEYESGRSSKDIANELSCSAAMICKILRQEGVEIRFKMKNTPEIDLMVPKMIEMWNNGIHLENIAKELKIAAMTVKTRLNKNGISTSKHTDINEILKHSDLIARRYEECGNSATIGKELNCSGATILRVLNKVGIKTKKSKLYSVNEEFFSKIETEGQAWVLGLMFSDGCCVTDKPIIKLQLKDKETIEKVQILLEYTGKIGIHKQREPYEPGYYLCIYSKKLKADLIKLGCLENKSLILKFPKLNDIPETLMSHFIRGYLDGDGSIASNAKIIKNGETYCKWYISFIGTQEVLQGIKYNIDKLVNINQCSFYKHNKNNESNTYQLCYNGSKCQGLANWIYKDATLYMERKYQSYLNLIEYFKYKRKEIKDYTFLSDLHVTTINSEEKIVPSKEYVNKMIPTMEKLFKENKSIKEIGESLDISGKTVSRHLQKMGYKTDKEKSLEEVEKDLAEIILKYKELKSTVKVANLFGTSAATILRILDKHGVEHHQRVKYSVNESYFDSIENEEKSYLLGLFFGTGNIKKKENSVIFGSTNKSMVESVKSYINYTGPIEEDRGYFRIKVSNPNFKASVSKFFPENGKSTGLQVPQINQNLTIHFLRGYFESRARIEQEKKQSASRWIASFPGDDNIVGFAESKFIELGLCEKLDKYKNYGKSQLGWLGHLYQNASIFNKDMYEKYVEMRNYYEV